MTEHSEAAHIDIPPGQEGERSRKLLARQVARYLLQNPDFFSEHMELLESIQLPRENGKTVSLMSHHSSLLRERNIEMRQRLSQLLHAARDNDQLFLHSRRLVLALLDARDLAEAGDALHRSFREDFGVQTTSLTLFTPFPGGKAVALGQVRASARSTAETAIGGILRNGRTVCGVLRPSEKNYLFGAEAESVASAAVVPLADQLGVLAVGSDDPQHYRSSLGTLFLSYIGEVLERMVPKLLQA